MVARKKAPTFLDSQDEAVARLSTGARPPLCVVTGEVEILKDRVVGAVLARADGEIETFVARPGESDAEAFRRLLRAWTTSSLFGGDRVLVVRGADALLRGGRLTELAGIAGAPHQLLLTINTLDGRSKLARRVRESGGLVNLPPLRDSPPPWHAGGPFLETELNQWIRSEARERSLAVDLSVADTLSQRIGNEPARLVQKLEQLAVLVAPRTSLTTTDIEDHVIPSSARLLGLYEEAVRRGEAGEALRLLDRMTRDGVYDHQGKVVAGGGIADVVLRGLTGSLARTVTAHEQLTPALLAALAAKPWERSAQDKEGLDRILGIGGRRVFLERDVKAVSPDGARAAFTLALQGLRCLRDGAGVSMHALTVHLARALERHPARKTSARRPPTQRAAW